ncbi:MAG: 4Fe-4S binding protein [Candidatus Lokiarchaeota archaeon]|nr:4Fe-4S binding protein [Candidatus Lokiarchaeota archaeon]
MKGWKEIPEGGLILNPGNSINYKTGSWRSRKPIRDEEKCIHCLVCWAYCPDGSIIIEDEKVIEINYDFCKGCGICANECPKEAIIMELEK